MKTRAEADAIAATTGPFNGLTAEELVGRLEVLGVSQADAEAYRQGILRGGVAIVVSAAAAETLRDHGATAVRILQQP